MLALILTLAAILIGAIAGVVILILSIRDVRPPQAPTDSHTPPALPQHRPAATWKIILMVTLAFAVIVAGVALLLIDFCGGFQNLKLG